MDYLSVGQDRETNLYHGLFYQYKPKPSGAERWILRFSTTEGFERMEDAAAEIEKSFPALPKIQFNEK